MVTFVGCTHRITTPPCGFQRMDLEWERTMGTMELLIPVMSLVSILLIMSYLFLSDEEGALLKARMKLAGNT